MSELVDISHLTLLVSCKPLSRPRVFMKLRLLGLEGPFLEVWIRPFIAAAAGYEVSGGLLEVAYNKYA